MDKQALADIFHLLEMYSEVEAQPGRCKSFKELIIELRAAAEALEALKTEQGLLFLSKNANLQYSLEYV